mmetsp:Transcript_175129/g.561642  ORF Transcript_175129/g.561642 Transcript_175129/m.561642 type:complete len:203 (-) Transcript_175129:33-641(-)
MAPRRCFMRSSAGNWVLPPLLKLPPCIQNITGSSSSSDTVAAVEPPSLLEFCSGAQTFRKRQPSACLVNHPSDSPASIHVAPWMQSAPHCVASWMALGPGILGTGGFHRSSPTGCSAYCTPRRRKYVGCRQPRVRRSARKRPSGSSRIGRPRRWAPSTEADAVIAAKTTKIEVGTGTGRRPRRCPAASSGTAGIAGQKAGSL